MITKLGRYDIKGEVGHGAMGVVYKGLDTAIDRIVAVKTIKLEKNAAVKFDKTTVMERFFQEARIAGKLSHPNIATIYDVGEDRGFHFIIMEFIEGVPLQKIIEKKRPLALLDKIRIITLSATALYYAHQRGIIHRDIKPANIMVLDDLQIKVMDFGIAKFISQKDLSTTQQGEIFGTPFYMSPEQISCRELDRQTDIFSLGVLSYELLTGVKPFYADSLASLSEKIIYDDPVPPHEVNKQLPAEVANAVLKALKKNKEERYLSAGEFVDDLELYLNQVEMGKAQDAAPAKGYDKKKLIRSLRKNYTFFSNFTDEELQTIFKISSKKVLRKKDVIFEEGTVGNKMFIIIMGDVKITKRFHKEGKCTTLAILHTGDCFGEMAIVDSAPRFASAIAESSCILIAINEVILRNSEPRLCLKLYKNLSSILSEKLKRSTAKIDQMQTALDILHGK